MATKKPAAKKPVAPKSKTEAELLAILKRQIGVCSDGLKYFKGIKTIKGVYDAVDSADHLNSAACDVLSDKDYELFCKACICEQACGGFPSEGQMVAVHNLANGYGSDQYQDYFQHLVGRKFITVALMKKVLGTPTISIGSVYYFDHSPSYSDDLLKKVKVNPDETIPGPELLQEIGLAHFIKDDHVAVKFKGGLIEKYREQPKAAEKTKEVKRGKTSGKKVSG